MFARRTKRGSLELSVNAIIIIILAIAILGLGITFVKSMWDRTTGQIRDINKDIEKRMLDDLKDRPDRLALDQDNMEIEKGRSKEIYFGLKNELDSSYTFSINGNGGIDVTNRPGEWMEDNSVIACYNSDGGGTLSGKNDKRDSISFRAVERMSISVGEIFVGKMFVDVNGRAPAATYYCAIIIMDPGNPGREYARKNFMVTVPG